MTDSVLGWWKGGAAVWAYRSSQTDQAASPGGVHRIVKDVPLTAQRVTVASVKEATQQQEPIQLTEWDEWLFTYMGKKSPVVPVGCFVTATILASGFYHFRNGNKHTSNLFMRARVVAQAITVGCMMASIKVSVTRHL